MTNSNYLWQSNQDLSEACLQHLFLRGIADGSLPQNSFAYYVALDTFFLGAFARAYSIAAAKAPDWEGFEILHNLGSGVAFFNLKSKI
jgi:thiaminase (transcriptional activator TenA)